MAESNYEKLKDSHEFHAFLTRIRHTANYFVATSQNPDAEHAMNLCLADAWMESQKTMSGKELHGNER